ncbi:maltose ABC transporter ATP-binding protein [Xenorhabdus eapokensis]|uniref:Maltose ABC transporter ATP-binding protein n=1 Tax=Xenorhabdus eapokensis TaxID=1873482 RepID=A0A1Q5TPG5_9GAMM|nr:maltose ABC transporter ATP-binding protein [Xenorhabdus eapokensis]
MATVEVKCRFCHQTKTSPSRRLVSMLFQKNNLFSHLNTEQKNILQQIAFQVSLEAWLSRLHAQLSGEQRQRAALARCLVRHQPILLLDEPFSALDPALRNEMLELLDQICTEQQMTLLMVSHNLDDAAKIAPRSLLIVDGKIHYDGATEKLVRGEAAEAVVLGIYR